VLTASALYFQGVEPTPTQATEQQVHTHVPEIIQDCIKPLCSSAERDCLDYIIRLTYGYADPAGGRKARDTIALDQFEHGQSIGNYVRDLGTGLSRPVIKKALRGLEEKGLVDVRYSCGSCLWEQRVGEAAPEVPEGQQLRRCPRCHKVLSRSWAVAELTPAKVKNFLNTYDPKHRVWQWDATKRQFYFEDAEGVARREVSESDLREEAVRLYRLLWFNDLVEEAVKLAQAQLQEGHKITLTRRIGNFYRPVWELQERYNNPPLLRYALEQTIEGPALRSPNTRGWHKYLARVCENNALRYAGGGVAAGTNAAKTANESIAARERAVRELLRQAYALNKADEFEPARALLSDILSQTKALAELFDGDEEKCDRALREAFKQGSSDFVGVKPNPRSPVDFYREWSWSETTSTPEAAQAALA
jgi:hypothetical protein